MNIAKSTKSVEKNNESKNFNPVCVSTEFDSRYCKCLCSDGTIWIKISRMVFDIVESKYFEIFIFFIIFVSSFALVINIFIFSFFFIKLENYFLKYNSRH